MKRRFEGNDGRRRLIEALRLQKMASGDAEIASALADRVELMTITAGEHLIHEGGSDSDVYLVIVGSLSILARGKWVATRSRNDHVGEIAAIDTSQSRSATVRALEDSVVCRITEVQLTELGDLYPVIWRNLAIELSKRLVQRNTHLRVPNQTIQVFIVSSTEALPIANAVRDELQKDGIVVVIWSKDVFKPSDYALESLEGAFDRTDFALIVAEPDDTTTTRGQAYATPRDNVIFELGLFMGCLGRRRTLLLEPAGSGVKLPSDFKGLTTIRYERATSADAANVSDACATIKRRIAELGPRV